LPASKLADRLDHRLAAGRLRGRHVRAVARALARRGAGDGLLSCRDVSIGRPRRVRFAAAETRAAGAPAADALSLAQHLAWLGAARRAEQLLAAFALAADEYGVFAGLAPPVRGAARVIAIGGLVASGKSTVAKAAARQLAAPRVVADRVREALLDDAGARDAHELVWRPEFGERVYAGVLARAGAVLASGRSVIVDACFPNEARRRAAEALAARHRARFVFGWCEAPREEVAERLRLRDARDGVAPGSWEKLARGVEAACEPPRSGAYVAIDTSRPKRAWLDALGLAKEEA
jgi:predicted kinase